MLYNPARYNPPKDWSICAATPLQIESWPETPPKLSFIIGTSWEASVARARKSMMCVFEREDGAVRIVRSQEELWARSSCFDSDGD